jgi:hypothetical protein
MSLAGLRTSGLSKKAMLNSVACCCEVPVMRVRWGPGQQGLGGVPSAFPVMTCTPAC